MKGIQQANTCSDDKLEDIADAMELVRDAIQTRNMTIIKGVVESLKSNPDLPFHFIVSALELNGEIEKNGTRYECRKTTS